MLQKAKETNQDKVTGAVLGAPAGLQGGCLGRRPGFVTVPAGSTGGQAGHTSASAGLAGTDAV